PPAGPQPRGGTAPAVRRAVRAALSVLRHQVNGCCSRSGASSAIRKSWGSCITTTERYDNQKLENLQTGMMKLETGKSFDTNDPRAQNALDDADKVSSFFQDQAKVSAIEAQEPDRKTG